jgi:hypothetical protein
MKPPTGEFREERGRLLKSLSGGSGLAPKNFLHLKKERVWAEKTLVK